MAAIRQSSYTLLLKLEKARFVDVKVERNIQVVQCGP